MKKKRINKRSLMKWQVFLSFVFGIGTFVIAYLPMFKDDVDIGEYIIFKTTPNIVFGILFCTVLLLIMWRINIQIINPVNNHWITKACEIYYHENKHLFPYDHLSWLESLSFEDMFFIEQFLYLSINTEAGLIYLLYLHDTNFAQ